MYGREGSRCPTHTPTRVTGYHSQRASKVVAGLLRRRLAEEVLFEGIQCSRSLVA